VNAVRTVGFTAIADDATRHAITAAAILFTN
jgi:hypothetical protein